jgi:hypothetical protein
MKVLVILIGNEMLIEHITNIKILNDYMIKSNIQVEYCGISSSNDFYKFDNTIFFKYKMINDALQFTKICDFITENENTLNYDWYIKFRPDIKLLEQIDFSTLKKNSVNARARMYNGPAIIKWGMSVGGEGIWNQIRDCTYNKDEFFVLLDDMVYIFDNEVIKNDAFKPVHSLLIQTETEFNNILKSRNIKLNVIGIDCVNTKYQCRSGHLNVQIGKYCLKSLR